MNIPFLKKKKLNMIMAEGNLAIIIVPYVTTFKGKYIHIKRE